MREVYVDSSHHIAVLDRRDSLHAIAARAARDIETTGARLVTSEDALLEVLTYFSASGPEGRFAAVEYWNRLRTMDINIIPQSRGLLDAALDLYARRPDKRYSMIDCIGMVICAERGITEVLTADHDFEQEGLTILLV